MPPPQPEQTTAHGCESIINFTKSKVLPNPNSTVLASVDKNSATRVLATATYTRLEHKYFDNTLSRADIAAAFGCNISQLTKAVTGVLYKSGPHHYIPKGSKATKKRPCDTTDPEASKAALKKQKTEKRAPQDQPSTSRSEAETQTVVQEDTLSSNSSDEVLQPGLFD